MYSYMGRARHSLQRLLAYEAGQTNEESSSSVEWEAWRSRWRRRFPRGTTLKQREFRPGCTFSNFFLARLKQNTPSRISRPHDAANAGRHRARAGAMCALRGTVTASRDAPGRCCGPLLRLQRLASNARRRLGGTRWRAAPITAWRGSHTARAAQTRNCKVWAGNQPAGMVRTHAAAGGPAGLLAGPWVGLPWYGERSVVAAQTARVSTLRAMLRMHRPGMLCTPSPFCVQVPLCHSAEWESRAAA
jgi:hypothetical protein